MAGTFSSEVHIVCVHERSCLLQASKMLIDENHIYLMFSTCFLVKYCKVISKYGSYPVFLLASYFVCSFLTFLKQHRLYICPCVCMHALCVRVCTHMCVYIGTSVLVLLGMCVCICVSYSTNLPTLPADTRLISKMNNKWEFDFISGATATVQTSM